MNLVEAVLRRVADDLLALGLPWAVVGGFAVSARAEPRFTRDVDVAVAVAGDDEAEAEATIDQLTARGYRLIAMTEQDGAAGQPDLDVAVEGVEKIRDRGVRPRPRPRGCA